MVIIEGLDATGKSTLARALASEYKFRVQESEGPPRSSEEFLERVHRYSLLTHTLFVRHPLISNPIYDIIRTVSDRVYVPQEEYDKFYSAGHLYIYCARTNIQVKHEVKEHDTPEHLTGIKLHDERLHRLYQDWAFKHAHIMYRIGDDVNRIVKLIRGIM